MYKASDHTFVLCAYGKNPYLEESLQRLKAQTLACPVIVSTSTPSAYIEEICKRYNVPMFVNPSPKGAARDWNYGFNQAETPLVTIAHQDDCYERDFVEIVIASHNAARFEVGLSFTDYYEMRPEGLVLDNRLLRIKRAMNAPFASLEKQPPRLIKERMLALGDSICCPSCTYNREILGDSPFDERYVNSCDYATYVRLAREGFGLLYIPAPLLGHRIYEGSATTQNIADDTRSREDFEIMSSLWPEPFAKLLHAVYSKSEESNATGDIQEQAPASEALAYSASDIVRMGWSYVATRVAYPGARLVRRPISIRGKRGFRYGRGFASGKNCRIEVFEDGEIRLGENVRIGDNVHITASDCVAIGDECLFASKVYISDTSHGSYGKGGCSPDTPPNARPLTSDPVRIGRNVWLGENVVVLPGVTIGDGCIVGANATVAKPLPAGCIAVGSPAKPIKEYDAEIGGWVPYGTQDAS